MGGRGGASGIGKKSQSALDPKAKEQTITTFYRRNSIYGPHYRDDVYEAVEQKNEKRRNRDCKSLWNVRQQQPESEHQRRDV